MHTHVIDNLFEWAQVRNCLDTFAGEWAFRGQRDALWKLESTLQRATRLLPLQMAETLMYRNFTRNMHGYLQQGELPNGILETLALMQHHGAPTRLLDFTHSAYVALFFALEHATDETGTCAVWAVDTRWCTSNGVAQIRAALGALDPAKWSGFKIGAPTLEPDDFKAIFFEDHRLELVLPVEPYRRHERLAIQQGLFLCPGFVGKGFEEILQAYDHDSPEKHLVKIVVPNRLRPEILRDLHYMNINRATLFPGIDGFAQSLHHAILHLEDHGQITRLIEKRHRFGAPFA